MSGNLGENSAFGEPETQEKIKPGSVLFVCGMNAIRSPMAEHLTKKLFPNQIFAQSAGVQSGAIDGFMLAVMDELGIDLIDHEPIMLEDLEEEFFDLIITLSPEAHHRAMDWANTQAAQVEYWPTLDPSTVAGSREQVLEAYRQTRDSLENKISARFSS